MFPGQGCFVKMQFPSHSRPWRIQCRWPHWRPYYHPFLGISPKITAWNPRMLQELDLGRRRRDRVTWISWLRSKESCLDSSQARDAAKFSISEVHALQCEHHCWWLELVAWGYLSSLMNPEKSVPGISSFRPRLESENGVPKKVHLFWFPGNPQPGSGWFCIYFC